MCHGCLLHYVNVANYRIYLNKRRPDLAPGALDYSPPSNKGRIWEKKVFKRRPGINASLAFMERDTGDNKVNYLIKKRSVESV